MLPLQPQPEYRTTKEVAKLLRCESETVAEYCRTRKLAGKKVGKNWLITPAAVAEFMARR